VRDEIVIKLVRQQIEQMEAGQKSWIIEGFPRTEAQAIALQKMGVIPDKFILLNQDDTSTLDAIMRNLSGEEIKAGISRIENMKQRERIARNAVLEYNLQIRGVENICRGFITELESSQSEMRVVEEINRILKLKNTNAPRRPQRIILMGSPGSKKEQFALRIAEKYQVVYVQVQQLIREVMRRNDDNDYARRLKSYIAQDRIGKFYDKKISHHSMTNLVTFVVPDEDVIDLVNERLSKPDCRLNGWILDGCPFNPKQLQMLRELKIEPQKVIALEVSDEVVLKDLSEQRLHQASGKLFTPEEIAQAPEEVKELLITRPLK